MNTSSIKNWLSDSVSAVREHGVHGLDPLWRQPYYKFLHQIDRVRDSGESIYDQDWDVLIILDACRQDLLYDVADEYDFLTEVGQVRSLDSMTPAWMERTFVEEYSEEMAETYYLCANPFSQKKLDGSDFAELDELWQYAWDDEIETVRPETVTDRCIEVLRNESPDRMLVHYVQPHWPFIPAMDLTNDAGLRPNDFGGYNKDEVWERLRRGEVSSEEVWDGYRENLKCALDSVEVLLENVDANDVVITSDHGNAFGEYGVYGHPMHMPLSCLRSVPYAETSATDERTRDPKEIQTGDTTDDVQKQLEALGYR